MKILDLKNKLFKMILNFAIIKKKINVLPINILNFLLNFQNY